MTDAEATADLYAALAKAQGEFPSIPRDKTVTVRTRDQGSYSFAYAPLDTILAAVRPVLAENSLAITQTLGDTLDGRPALKTQLLHASGAAIGGTFPLSRIPDTPQQLGSLLTYLRRYAIVSLLGIAAEEDDDGNHASGNVARSEGASESGTGGSAFQAPSEFHADRDGSGQITDAQRRKVYAMRTKLINAGVITDEQVKLVLGAEFGTESISELTRGQASILIDRLTKAERDAVEEGRL